ncbi:MAG TPA: hypothetical protein VGJ41_02565 [Nocardioides sp.]
MPEATPERRVRNVPSTGARLCLMIAALFVVAAVYFLLVPVQVTATAGKTFDCGNAMNGPKSSFAQGICGKSNKVNGYKAAATGVGALVTAVGGFLVFGMNRREEYVAAPAPRGALAHD